MSRGHDDDEQRRAAPRRGPQGARGIGSHPLKDRAPEGLAAAVLLAAAAAGILLLGAGRDAGAAARSAGFQRATGGIGGGRATALLPCEGAFDGGATRPCGRALDPLPGGEAFCPHHAGPLGRR